MSFVPASLYQVPLPTTAEVRRRVDEIVTFLRDATKGHTELKPVLFLDGVTVKDGVQVPHRTTAIIANDDHTLRISDSQHIGDYHQPILKQIGREMAKSEEKYHTMFYCAEAWTVIWSAEKPRPFKEISLDPDRKEIVMVTATVIDGRSIIAKLPIERDEDNHLILGEVDHVEMVEKPSVEKLANNIGAAFWIGYTQGIEELIRLN